MYKKQFLLIFILLAGFGAFAQSSTSSPYSRFGLGEIQKSNFLQSKGMGGLTQGLRNPLSINFNNPASYSAISLTTFEISAYSSILRLSNAATSQLNHNSSLGSFAFAFPVSPKWGSSFGLIPFSNVGYKITDTHTLTGSGDVTSTFEGRGGLNQFYIGNAWKPIKNLSAGLNVSYMFGNIKQIRSNAISDTSTAYNTRLTNSTFVGDIYLYYGLQYTHDLGNERSLILGYSGSPSMSLLAKRNLLGERYTGTDNIKDTVERTQDEKSTIVLPPTHALGFMFQKANKWNAGADIFLNSWSEYRAFGENPSLNNSYGFSVGGQITPDANAVGNYFKLMEYRAGLTWSRSYLHIKSTDINQAGVSFGLGFPLIKSNSKINLAVELGQRGTTQNNLILEQYATFHIGFIYNDQWFIKRRYD